MPPNLPIRLDAYLERIGFEGDARVDLATLTALHRAHLEAIPFENLAVQLGQPTATTDAGIFDKLVMRRRGGWCYEMNGLMGWALEQLGFDVTRVAAGVQREQVGEGQLGNHLCLLVRLPRPYLVDVGFGGTQRDPLPLEVGQRWDAPFHVGLSQTRDDYWRFEERARDATFTFDFRAARADEGLLARQCAQLATDPSSPFVQNLVVSIRRAARHLTLRGRVLTTTHAEGVEKVTLATPGALAATLRDTFGLDVPESAELWPAISARHDALFPSPDQNGA